MAAKLPKTFHDHRWRYDFHLPRLDIQRDFKAQAPGFFSRLIGVDGRYSGRLRRFPGWLKQQSLGLVAADLGGTNLDFFKPFAITQGSSGSGVVRGVLFLGVEGGSDKLFVSFSVDGGALSGKTVLKTFTNPPTYLDVAVDHQLLYIVGEESSTPPARIEFLARYAGSTGGWVTADWITTALQPLNMNDPDQPRTTLTKGTVADWPNTSPDRRSGHLEFGAKYGLSYRIVYPEQGFVGPLLTPETVETTERTNPRSGFKGDADSCYLLLNSFPVPADYGDIFSRAVVQVFRTPDRSFFDEAARGQLFLEAEFEVPRVAGADAAAQLLQTGTINPTTSYTQATKTLVDAGNWPVGTAAGDILYIQWPVRTRDANETTAEDKDYAQIIYRRRIESIAGTSIVIDRDLGLKNASGAAVARYWISKEGDGVDTRGTFAFDRDTSTSGTMSKSYNVMPVLAGWAPRESYLALDTTSGLDDRVLAMQPQLTPAEFSTFNQAGNPHGRFIAEHENLFVRITSASHEASGQDVLRYGFVDRPRKGLIPVLNRRLLSDLTDSVSGLVKADPFLVAILNNGLLRLHKSGDRMAVDTIHNRFGTPGAKSAVAIGTNLYFASPSGILLVDLTAGQVDVLNATQHFFDEGGTGTGKWRDDLTNIWGAYDALLGALLFLNATKFEMLVIWMNHGVFTHLIDVPFDVLVSSGDLQTGGLRRGLFYREAAGAFYTIDAAREADSRTTFSYASDGSEVTDAITYNGVATGEAGGKLIDSAANFGASGQNMAGHFVRVRTAEGTWKRSKIIGRDSATQLDLSALDGFEVSTGDHYSIGAIPLQFTAWPLSGHPEIEEQDLFSGRKVTSMGMFMANASRTPIAVDANDVSVDSFLYQLFERDHTLNFVDLASPYSQTPTSHAAKTEKPFGYNTTTTEYENALSFGKILRNSPILVPGVEVWSSNMDMDLLSMVVEGKIERSIKDTRPS